MQLLDLLSPFCHPLYILEDDRECIYHALANLAINLDFNPISFEDAFIHQTFTDRKRYIEIINSIKDDSILMCLTYTCQAILEWANHRFSEPNFIINIFQKLGYTFEESIAITQGKIIHKFNDDQQQKGTLTQNQNIDENEDSEYYTPSFVHNWKLSDFLKGWDYDIQVMETTDHLTGEIKYSLVFQNCCERQIYVNRVSHLTGLSIPEIVEKKEELLIGITQGCNFWLHDGAKVHWSEQIY